LLVQVCFSSCCAATIVRLHNDILKLQKAQLTSFFYFALRSKDLLLLDTWSVWIETTKFLSLLPGKYAVRSSLVFRRGHNILVDGREIRKVCSCSRRTCVNDLIPGCQNRTTFTEHQSFDCKALLEAPPQQTWSLMQESTEKEDLVVNEARRANENLCD
jgi:hypothetical protein